MPRTRRATRLIQIQSADPLVLRQDQLRRETRELGSLIAYRKQLSKVANDEQDRIEAILMGSTNNQDRMTSADIETLKQQYVKANTKQREIVAETTRIQTQQYMPLLTELFALLDQERARNGVRIQGRGRKRQYGLSRKKGKKRYS
jgi:hypothetical protein